MLFRIFLPILILIHFSVKSSPPLLTSSIPDEIITAIKSGNAKDLAKYFNQNIELIILNEEDVYSKAQAELILKDFFSKNLPSDFTILHQGGKESARYAIGTVKTAKGNFRMYFLLKIKNDQPFIHQLRIEKE